MTQRRRMSLTQDTQTLNLNHVPTARRASIDRRRFLGLGIAGASIGGSFMNTTSVLAMNQATPANEALYGGTLVVSMPYEPRFYNVNYDFDGGAPYLNMNVYSKLLNFDYVTNEIHPDLAESWEMSADGTQYTFHLRQNVVWHDGEPFTSADVRWTVEDILREGEASVAYLKVADIETIDTPDDHTITFSLAGPNSVFLMNLASYYGFNILPMHLYDGTDVRMNPANNRPIGTGPFRFVEHVVGSHASMESNTDYWGPSPFLDQLIFRFIRNLQTSLAALEAGEIGYSAASPPFGDIERIESIPNIAVDPTPSPIVFWFGFNFERPEYQDVRVRRAVAHAINRQEIADRLYQGRVEPAKGTYTSVIEWANNPDVSQPEFDPAQAERLLDEAGFTRNSDGVRFSTKFVSFITAIWGGPEQAQMIRQYLADVGINVELEVVEFALYNEKIRVQRDFDLVQSGGPRGPDPSEFFNFVGSTGSRNVMPWINERVDELFALARTSVDRDEQRQHYYEIQELVAEDVPMVNIVEYAYLRPYRTEFQGFWWQQQAVGTVGQDMYNVVQWEQGEPQE